MEILSSCFPRLVQDALDLPICRAFVATATILPGVNPLEPDVPPKSHCHTSTAVPIPEIDRLSRQPPQQIYLTAHPVFTLPESLQSKGLKTQDSMEWIFRTFGLSFIPTKSNHPGRFS